MAVVIRRTRISDIPCLHAAWKALSEESREAYHPELFYSKRKFWWLGNNICFFPSQIALTRSLLQRFFPRGVFLGLVMEDRETKGNVIGLIYVKFSKDSKKGIGPFLAIFVRDEFQDRGYGSALCREMICFVAKEKTPSINVTVNKMNERALNLYSKEGF